MMCKIISRRLRKEVELYFEDIGSRQVAERLMKLKSFFDVRGVAATLLRGNHERYFIENVKVLERGNDLLAIFEAKQDNRSRKTYQEMIGCIKGFTQEFDLLKECKNFFAAMPYFFHDVQNNLFFVHAGIHPDKVMGHCSPDDYTTIREKFFMYTGTYPSIVIFGHTPMDSLNDDERLFLNVETGEEVMKRLDRIGLDSGNYRGNAMNVLRIRDGIFSIIKVNKHEIGEEKILNLAMR